MEEEVGFEPTVRSHVRRFSRPLQSTALALLQRYSIGNNIILHKTFFFVKRILIIYFCYRMVPEGRISMFDYLKGLITDKKNSSKGLFVTIEVANVGYLLEVTEKDFSCFEVNDENLKKIYVHLVHREDNMSIYGFFSKETRDIFQILLSVSGVGAKMAIALLSEFDACDLISLVIDGNFKELTRAKGVGPKLAQKIILELKDKLMKVEIPKCSFSTIPQNQAFEDTQAILLSLGYSEGEIGDAINKVMSTINDKSNSEEILRKVLTILSM